MVNITEQEYQQENIDAMSKLKIILKKYGILIIVVIGILIVTFSYFQYKKNVEINNYNKASISYQKFISNLTNTSDIKIQISEGIKITESYKTTIYSDLTRLLLAKIYVSQNNLNSAKLQLKEVIKNSNNLLIKTLANVRLGKILISSSKNTDIQSGIYYLKIASETKSFSSDANELIGDGYKKLKDKIQALKYWNLAVVDAQNNNYNISKITLLKMKISSLNL